MSTSATDLKKFFKKLTSKPPSVEVDWDMTARDWIAIIIAAFGAFMALLDIQVTNSSMREIQNSLGISLSEGGWISTAYLIAEIMIIPLAPTLVNAFGLGHYLMAGAASFAVTSVLCSFAWDLPSLASFRFLQGLAGGTLIPVVLQMILIYMPVHRRPIGLAIFGLVATLAPSIGPTIGGWLSMTYGWRSVFLVNLFPSLLVIYSVRRVFPPSFLSLSVLKKADWMGAFLLCSSVGSLTFMLEEGSNRGWFQDGLILLCMAITTLGLPAFVYWENRQINPLLNMSLFKDRSFTVSSLITFLAAQCLYGGMYALSVFLGGIRGYSPSEIGSILAWAGIPQILVIPAIPYLMKKVDPRLLAIFGLFLFGFSNWLNTGINEDYGSMEFRWTLILRAISQPFFTIPLSALAVQRVPPSLAGAASSIVNMTRNLGGSVGIALVSYIIKNHVDKYSAVLSDTLSLGATQIREISTTVKYSLWFWGADVTQADAITNSLLNSHLLREAYFHCFIEAFAILFFELLIAGLITLLVPFERSQMEANAPAGMH